MRKGWGLGRGKGRATVTTRSTGGGNVFRPVGKAGVRPSTTLNRGKCVKGQAARQAGGARKCEGACAGRGRQGGARAITTNTNTTVTPRTINRHQ